MSTSSDHLVVMNAPVERRFYPRVSPSVPIYVAFGPNNLGTLQNVSENGLQVSVPSGLEVNSVYRVFLCLNGIPNTITVQVRTVWSAESQKRSGIQLLDLSEEDRAQIRNWATLQTPEGASPEPWYTPAKAETRAATLEPPVAPSPAPLLARESVAKSEAAPSLGSLYSPVDARPVPQARNEIPAYIPNAPAPRLKSRSTKPLFIVWTASMAGICLAAGWHFRREISGKFRQDSALVSQQREPEDGQKTAPLAVPDEPTPIAPAQVRPDVRPDNDAESSPAAAVPTDAPVPTVTPEARTPTRAGKYLRHLAPAAKPTLVWSAKQSAQIDPPEVGHSYGADSAVASMPVTSAIPTPAKSPAPVAAATSSPGTGPVTAPVAPPAAVAASPMPTAVDKTAQFGNAQAINTSTAKVGSAITGSISDSASSADFAAAKPANSASVAARPPTLPASSVVRNTPFVASKSNASGPPVIQMDVPQARVMEVSPPRSLTSSYVSLPGERVLRSSSITMHVQRLVWVRGDLWLWRTHKRVTLGELASRVDPQISQLPAGSGSITVQASIDKDGYVANLKPLYGSFAFFPVVAKAIREWHYEPTYLDNKPVDTQAKIEIEFHATSPRTSRP
jgi:PilZ domain/Gram-negative bacterial TonB protein C-terminal